MATVNGHLSVGELEEQAIGFGARPALVLKPNPWRLTLPATYQRLT
jgi:hypothetical protein